MQENYDKEKTIEQGSQTRGPREGPIGPTNIRCQFHQRSTSSFCARRSQKREKYN